MPDAVPTSSSEPANGARPPGPSPAKNMVWIPGGEFLMGSDDFYPEERPAHRVAVDGFWIDPHPVTVAEFRRFVKATGHVTVAELAPDPAEYPDADPELLVPGSLVFNATDGPVDLTDVHNWWSWTPGAQWRNPEGPGQHPARARASPGHPCRLRRRARLRAWAGKELPTRGPVGARRARRTRGQGLLLG